MFDKERTFPEIILLHEILLKRLGKYHPKRARIKAEKAGREAGYKGEKELDRKLKKLPYDKFHILSDVRLPCGDEYFQMDSFVLTTSFGTILETKNISGDLSFEKETDQFTREKKDLRKERFQNPILQAMDQGIELNRWLDGHNLPQLPLEYFFVNSHPKSRIIIGPGNKEIQKYICSCENVHFKVNNLINKYPTERISQEVLQKIVETIKKEHTPKKVNILKMYFIALGDILTGVHCPNCEFLPMVYKWGAWHCSKCKMRSKNAHIRALYDYFLLIQPFITNKELCRFLHIPSPDIATRILQSLGLPYTGTFRDRVYFLPPSTFLSPANFPLNSAPLIK